MSMTVRMPFDGDFYTTQLWGQLSGYPRGTRNADGANGHPGVDYGCPMGTPLYAIADGVVTHAGYADGFGADCVTIWHPQFGITTLYGHCDAMYVQLGQQVAVGEHVADSDNEGASTGPHLHFEIRPVDSPFGGNPPNIDPEIWLAAHLAATPPVIPPATDWLDTVDEATLRAIINDEVTKVLNTGTARGQTSWAHTNQAILGQEQTNFNAIRAVAGGVLQVHNDLAKGK